MQHEPVLLGSITDATDAIRGRVVVSGSHGGLYPAAVASGFFPRGVIFHDAGIGLENAGIAGVLALDKTGLAAAAVSSESCRIGCAEALLETGWISRSNPTAARLGIMPGMMAKEAARIMETASTPISSLDLPRETRKICKLDPEHEVVLLDSASLVGPADKGKTVVTGSHGALIGGDPARALKAQARVAVFNDAGFTRGDYHASRLPALDKKGIAAVLVSCATARIGDAQSALNSGVISFANDRAQNTGANPGLRLRSWLKNLPAV